MLTHSLTSALWLNWIFISLLKDTVDESCHPHKFLHLVSLCAFVVRIETRLLRTVCRVVTVLTSVQFNHFDILIELSNWVNLKVEHLL